MQNYKILHIMHNEKFIASFIKIINMYFSGSDHLFLIIGGEEQEKIKVPKNKNVLYFTNEYEKTFNYYKYHKLLKDYTKNVEKIILHSMLSNNRNLFFFLNKNLLSKSYWIMWGADLYGYNKQPKTLKDKFFKYIKKEVFSKFGHYVTYLYGDYKLAKKWYSANGIYHECFMYPSNLYKEYEIKEKQSNEINIQVGNSADPSNNHLEVFEKLKKYKDENIKIYVPLSYGNQQYSKEVIIKGKEIFGDKFIPMTEFMSFKKYIEFLGKIDIAIFAHNRQQAMGNIITLLGLGKKIYMRCDITPWEFFYDIDVKVYGINNIELGLIDKDTKNNNKEKIKNHFSKENYLKQLKNLFGNN